MPPPPSVSTCKMCDWCYVALLCHPTFNSSASGSSPSATYCEIYNGFLGLGALCLIWTFLPSKKNLRRVLIFEVIGIPGQWVNDDTIFLVSRSDTISSKSGIDGKINLYRTLCAATSYTYITHSEIEIWDKTRPSIPLFEEMVSLLLTRKIVSSFTHWPRMPMTSKSRLRFFFA